MSVRPHPTKSKSEPGKWWVIDIGRGKQRERITFNGSYEEAWRYERSFRQQPDHVVEGSVPKIKDVVTLFLDWYRTENPINTVTDMRFCMDNHIIPWFGNFQPKQLTVALFNKFKADLLDQGLAPVTINKNMSYLSSLIKWAAEHGNFGGSIHNSNQEHLRTSRRCSWLVKISPVNLDPMMKLKNSG